MDLNCAHWRKSRHSGSDGGHCVEVATNLPGTVLLRDSKDRTRPPISCPRANWLPFLSAAQGAHSFTASAGR
ncbi:hypothetical protein Sru01_31960 [Sphaerisporangium rufum]|uniref:DUF397 domain-containing protein n=1 Tax=Sphaerisporangium rufum TaxID=1381558 RepID=A0A919R241_9ACTN|nr:DUF397 domain-containing protein [Sphaerisporangium rufum]GII78214.1 hypothetical protein Sru01_31960 [Sphaerisporangium rufum]